MSIREDLRRLVDEIPDHQAHLAKRLIEALLEEEDVNSEPLTPEDLEDIKEAKAAFERGEFVPWDEVKRELALPDAEEDFQAKPWHQLKNCNTEGKRPPEGSD